MSLETRSPLTPKSQNHKPRIGAVARKKDGVPLTPLDLRTVALAEAETPKLPEDSDVASFLNSFPTPSVPADGGARDGGVPLPAVLCWQEIIRRRADCAHEGLFRRSPLDESELDKVSGAIDEANGDATAIAAAARSASTDCLAALIKRYAVDERLRPLLSPDEVAALDAAEDEAAAYSVLTSLSGPKGETITFLVGCAVRTAAHERVTRMGPRAMATALAPVIFDMPTTGEPMELLTAARRGVQLTAKLVEGMRMCAPPDEPAVGGCAFEGVHGGINSLGLGATAAEAADGAHELFTSGGEGGANGVAPHAPGTPHGREGTSRFVGACVDALRQVSSPSDHSHARGFASAAEMALSQVLLVAPVALAESPERGQCAQLSDGFESSFRAAGSASVRTPNSSSTIGGSVSSGLRSVDDDALDRDDDDDDRCGLQSGAHGGGSEDFLAALAAAMPPTPAGARAELYEDAAGAHGGGCSSNDALLFARFSQQQAASSPEASAPRALANGGAGAGALTPIGGLLMQPGDVSTPAPGLAGMAGGVCLGSAADLFTDEDFNMPADLFFAAGGRGHAEGTRRRAPPPPGATAGEMADALFGTSRLTMGSEHGTFAPGDAPAFSLSFGAACAPPAERGASLGFAAGGHTPTAATAAGAASGLEGIAEAGQPAALDASGEDEWACAASADGLRARLHNCSLGGGFDFGMGGGRVGGGRDGSDADEVAAHGAADGAEAVEDGLPSPARSAVASPRAPSSPAASAAPSRAGSVAASPASSVASIATEATELTELTELTQIEDTLLEDTQLEDEGAPGELGGHRWDGDGQAEEDSLPAPHGLQAEGGASLGSAQPAGAERRMRGRGGAASRALLAVSSVVGLAALLLACLCGQSPFALTALAGGLQAPLPAAASVVSAAPSQQQEAAAPGTESTWGLHWEVPTAIAADTDPATPPPQPAVAAAADATPLGTAAASGRAKAAAAPEALPRRAPRAPKGPLLSLFLFGGMPEARNPLSPMAQRRAEAWLERLLGSTPAA